MIDEFLVHARRAGKRDRYLVALRRTLELYELESGPLADATAEKIEAFLDRRPLCNAARAVHVAHFSSFFRWAFRFELLDGRNPMDRVVRPKVPPGMPKPIDREQLAHALEVADRPISTYLRLASLAGLRACEIAGLRAENVRSEIFVTADTAKGGRERVVPTHPALQVELVGYPRRGWLFPNESASGPVTAGRVSDQVSRFFRRNEIDGTLHRCRHYFATELLRASGDLLMVQRLMGHQSLTQTIKYTAYVDSGAARSVAMIA
jgi:integrase/recombinase XerD